MLRSILLISLILTVCQAGLCAERNRVHAVVDLGHQFTFYADGRFHRQYLPSQPMAMSWGSLVNFDFSVDRDKLPIRYDHSQTQNAE